MRGFALAAIACLGIGAAGLLDSTGPQVRFPVPRTRERPIVNVPLPLREENWRGATGGGSCVHASWIMLLRWQGQYAWADYWRTHYGSGESYNGLMAKLEYHNLRWAGTVGKADVAFLEWSHRTRRGAIVTWSERHVVCLVHFDEKWAGVLDNNEIDRIKWIPREEFVQEWINRGSWAMTPIYTPPPPLGV